MKIVFRKNLYLREAILASACQFLEDCYLTLNEDKQSYIINISGKKTLSMKALKDNVVKEVVNNALRCGISERNKEIREAVINRALLFSQPRKESLSLSVEKNLEKTAEYDWKDDPLGIFAPWKGDKKKKNNNSK